MLPLLALAVLLFLTFCQPVPVRLPRPPGPEGATQVGGGHVVYLPLAMHGGPVVTAVKRGVAAPYRESECADAYAVGAGWLYDWSATPSTCYGLEAVPLAFSGVPAALGGTSGWLMGGNECDRADQCNTAPEAYAAVWREIERRFSWRKLAAPAPSDADREWLVRFRDAYISRYDIPPRLDVLAMHCYQTVDGCIELGEWYLARAEEWGVPGGVWVSEFAFADVADYARFTGWMDAQAGITRYAAFATRVHPGEWWWTGTYDPSLILPDGSLSEIGRKYAQQ